jgi:1,4-alpha-glucan branching enzyme
MFKNLNDNMSAYTSNLKQVLNQYTSLKSGQIVGTYRDNNHNVHVHHTKLGAEELLVIKNYGQGFHNKNYSYYGFPENSTWEEVFNSDDKLYGGSGYTNSGRADITNHNQNLSLAPNSFLILKKVS